MLLLRRWTVGCAIAMLLGSAALAAERRVENVAQFDEAVRASQPGDVVVLASGEWSDVDLVFDAEGTANAPITLRAETPGKTVIIGKSRLRIAGEHLVVSGLFFTRGHFNPAAIEFRRDSKRHASHSRLTDCAIFNYNPEDGSQESKWISLYGTHNRVDHCDLVDKHNKGTTLVVWLDDEPAEHRIDHNYFGPRPDLKKNGGETIRIGDSATQSVNARCVVEHNVFEECDGEVEIISSKSCENVFRFNTFRACSGALTLRHGNRCLVEGNFFFGDGKRGSGGVRVIGEDHRVVNNYLENLAGDDTRSGISLQMGVVNSPPEGHFQVQRAVVAFNTLVGCKRSLVLGVADDDEPATLAPLDCVIANNIFVGDKGPLLEVQHEPLNCQWLGNLVHGKDAGPEISGVTLSDPRLAGDEHAPWRLNDDSPALDAAATGSFHAVTVDIDGQPRGNPADAGCDEQSDVPITNQPLTSADVGTSWGKKSL